MNLKEISDKRQKKRKDTDLYKVREDTSKPKFYILDMFPYPSGAGLHVGHPKGYIATDTLARKKMLEGFSVLHPMGFDTFGLGTENYAIEHKMKPQDVAKQNIATYLKQLEMFGTTYDRSRSVNTADPKYFKRTQRVFLQMYNHYYDEKLKKAMPVTDPSKQQRLAYVDYKPINRCPKCMTGLANEDLDEGKCERCGSQVEQKPMKQRVLRITKYAERLLEGLDTLKREESMKDLERNRIGKSEGTEFTMKIITEEKNKAAWMVIEKSIEATALQELLSFGEVHIEATDSDRGNFYRILIDKKNEKKLIAFLGKNLRIKGDKGEPSYWYADSDGTTNMVVFSGGKTFNTSTDEGCKEARDHGISLGIPEHQVNFSPRTYAPGYKDHSKRFSVYTTRVDTVFGMSFVAIAPEHELVDKITTKEHKKEVEKYKEAAKHKTQLERTELQKEKTGVFCGAYAINPFNNEKVPVYVADYVLANYGTGVVMAVPAHDERDYEFAHKYNLPISRVITPTAKRKALIIHGFEGSSSRNRLPRLTKQLEKLGCEVYNETLPHPDHPNYEETMKFLQPYFDELDETSLLIGHSLGGKFALKLLEGAKKKIGTTLLVAPVTNLKRDRKDVEKDPEWKGSDIVALKEIREIPLDLKSIDNNCVNKFLLLAKDDPYISLDTPTSLSKKWTTVILDKKGHFQDTEDQDILNLAKDHLTCYTEKGVLVNSGEFSGLASEEAISKMNDRLKKKGIGGSKVNYKMQDRVFSRQRYRGEPFPILRDESGNIVALDEKDLPLELPDVENYAPTGTEEGPLALITDRVNVTKDGKKYKRETNTMPGRAGSSRYRLRYMDPTNDKALVGKDKEKYRGNVDVYVGGAEHITRHMIYARFRQKFLYDIGVVTHQEPFEEYHYVGLIMGEDNRKMSKRRGNVINPDDIVNQHGADTLRTYEMFMGPFEQAIAWNTAGISGSKKFLDKVQNLSGKIKDDVAETDETRILLNQSIKKLTENIDEFKFNTAISQLMILTNHLTDIGNISRATFETLVILLSPFAPHLAEELWEQLGNTYSIFTTAKRPKYDEKYLVADTITIAVQINGKVRGTISLSQEAEENEAMSAARADAKIAARIVSEPKKVIYIKGKILNIVV